MKSGYTRHSTLQDGPMRLDGGREWLLCDRCGPAMPVLEWSYPTIPNLDHYINNHEWKHHMAKFTNPPGFVHYSALEELHEQLAQSRRELHDAMRHHQQQRDSAATEMFELRGRLEQRRVMHRDAIKTLTTIASDRLKEIYKLKNDVEVLTEDNLEEKALSNSYCTALNKATASGMKWKDAADYANAKIDDLSKQLEHANATIKSLRSVIRADSDFGAYSNPRAWEVSIGGMQKEIVSLKQENGKLHQDLTRERSITDKLNVELNASRELQFISIGSMQKEIVSLRATLRHVRDGVAALVASLKSDED